MFTPIAVCTYIYMYIYALTVCFMRQSETHIHITYKMHCLFRRKRSDCRTSSIHLIPKVWCKWTSLSRLEIWAANVNCQLLWMQVSTEPLCIQHNRCPRQAGMTLDDVIMSAMASQITDGSSVYSTVCSYADQRKHRSSASLAFVRGIHRWPANSHHKGPVTQKMF